MRHINLHLLGTVTIDNHLEKRRIYDILRRDYYSSDKSVHEYDIVEIFQDTFQRFELDSGVDAQLHMLQPSDSLQLIVIAFLGPLLRTNADRQAIVIITYWYS